MKKETVKEDVKTVKYPIVKDGKFVCSDGSEYSDGYFAKCHEKSLNQ